MKYYLLKDQKWQNFFQWLQYTYKDDLYILTCVPFQDRTPLSMARFSDDNIIALPDFIRDMTILIDENEINAINMVLRVFLPEMIQVKGKDKPIKIPRKEIFHFQICPPHIIGFNEEEVYSSQNTHAETRETLPHEEGVHYRSSMSLIESFFDKFHSEKQKIKEYINSLQISQKSVKNEKSIQSFELN